MHHFLSPALTLTLTLLLTLSTHAADSVELPAQENFHLYLLIGQSNMAGRGAIEVQDKTPPPRVLKFTKDKKWAPATDPLHFDKPIAGVGLGTSFGRVMAEADEGVVVGLIPCAVGGTPLARWEKDGDLYKQAVERAQAAQKVGTLKGILWHQGESDSGNATTAESYGKRLAGMVAALREELTAPNAPFVAGELGFFKMPKEGGKPNFKLEVNRQIKAIPDNVSHSAVASSEGLKDKGDSVHFDSASLREFGKRYAAAMLELQSAK